MEQVFRIVGIRCIGATDSEHPLLVCFKRREENIFKVIVHSRNQLLVYSVSYRNSKNMTARKENILVAIVSFKSCQSFWPGNRYQFRMPVPPITLLSA